MRRAARCIPLLLLGLSGCATYAPAPLPLPQDLLFGTISLTESATQVARVPRQAPINLQAPLNDLDLGRLALVASPELAAARASAGVAEAQLFAAGLLPDPQLAFSLDQPSGTGLVNALTLGASIDLAALFTHRQRRDSAQHSAEQARLDLAWIEWLTFNQVRTLARRVVSLQAQQDLAEQASVVAAHLLEVTEHNLALGDARLDDAVLHRVGLLDSRSRSLQLRRQLSAARQELNAALGLPSDTLLSLAGAVDCGAAIAALDVASVVRAAAVDRLDIRALQAGYAAQEGAVQLAYRQALPLPQLSLARSRDTGAIWTRGIGIGMTLPLWNRNRGDIAISEATRVQLAAEYRARIQRMQADIHSQIEDLRALQALRDAVAEQLPALQAALQVFQRAVAAGSLSVLTYETLRGELLARQLDLLALQQAQAEGEVALQTAAGSLLWASP